MPVSSVLNYPEEQTESVNIEKIFILSLVAYMKEIETYFDNKKSVRNSCKDIFYEYTLPFIKKWNKNTQIKDFIRINSQFINEYFSFGLFYNGSIILFPHRIISELLYNNGDFLSQFDYYEDENQEEDINIELFFKKFWNINNKDNYSLNKNDINIIKYYTSYNFMTNNRRFPSQELLAEQISCDKRTVCTRSARLYESYIMSHTYLINIAKLGYQTIGVILSSGIKDSDQRLSSFCLGTLPLNFGLKDGYLKMYQIPYWKNEIFYKIKELNPIAQSELTQLNIGWNMSDLNPKPKDRWKNMPPIFINSNWTDEIISVDKGHKISLIPPFDPIKINKSHAKMFMYFLENGTAKEIQLADYSSLNPDSITRMWKFISNKKLVIPYTTLRSIGLDISLWIMVMVKEHVQSQLIIKTMKHLSLFPHFRLYYSDSLLVGKISIPSSWIKSFSRIWNTLNDLESISRCGVMDENFHIQRNINILDTLF